MHKSCCGGDCALDMEQRSNDAAGEGCSNHVQQGGVCIRHGAKKNRKDAAGTDVQTNFNKEEYHAYAGGM